MKILLTGRNGQVGWELERALRPSADIIATDRATCNLANPDEIRRVVREVKPQVIVNAAAYTAVDRAESEIELAMRVNGSAPGILAEEAARTNALLIHYSTDYIFDGLKGSPYVETDTPAPLNVYGRSKLAGEQAIQSAAGRHIIFRTAWVYGSRGRNFLQAILAKASKGETLRVVDDQTGAPTWSKSIAQATVSVLDQSASCASGIYHLSAAGETSWFGFAREILRLKGINVLLMPISTQSYPTGAARPRYSVLSCAKFEKEFGLPLAAWDVALAACLES